MTLFNWINMLTVRMADNIGDGYIKCSFTSDQLVWQITELEAIVTGWFHSELRIW